ncbi:hypothetical protein [Streptomyces sp. NPDC055036]
MSKLLIRNRFTVQVIGARIPRGAVLIATGKQGPAFRPVADAMTGRTGEAPDCPSCSGFTKVKVRDGARLLRTITCQDPSHAVTAGVIDDVEDEDNSKGFEPEDLLVRGRVA